jgi:hypothetical protein
MKTWRTGAKESVVEPPKEDSNTSKSPASRTRLYFLLGVLLFLALYLLVAWVMHISEKAPLTHVVHPEAGYAFPELSDIVSITVTVDDQGKQHEFEAPKDSWNKIIAGLTPSDRDATPKKREPLGMFTMMIIRTKQGGVHCIDLYHSRDKLGAFSAGPSFERGMYYRGGNSGELEWTLREAYRQSKE